MGALAPSTFLGYASGLAAKGPLPRKAGPPPGGTICTAMNTKKRSAAVDSVWVTLNSGTASSVVLMTEGGRTTQLQGEAMWRWLREWSRQWPPPKKVRTSLQTSRGFVRNDRQAHFAWEARSRSGTQDDT